jgi:hypothetical protein
MFLAMIQGNLFPEAPSTVPDDEVVETLRAAIACAGRLPWPADLLLCGLCARPRRAAWRGPQRRPRPAVTGRRPHHAGAARHRRPGPGNAHRGPARVAAPYSVRAMLAARRTATWQPCRIPGRANAYRRGHPPAALFRLPGARTMLRCTEARRPGEGRALWKVDAEGAGNHGRGQIEVFLAKLLPARSDGPSRQIGCA